MTDLRAEARDRPCMVRLPGVCNGNRATTVLAHIRLSGISGMGVKAPDELGAWCCSDCHAAIDRQTRPKHLTKEQMELAHWQGVGRTFKALRDEGKV